MQKGVINKMADLGLIANVKDDKVDYTPTSTEKASTKGTSDLGKDAFLQLLVCQMQNQDPLNPSNDTEYVSQLAQFSQLEQLQNIGNETEKSQAFSLVGKHVIFQVTDSNGKTTYPEGNVESVSLQGKKMKIFVNGTAYDYENLFKVIGDNAVNPAVNETEETAKTEDDAE